MVLKWSTPTGKQPRKILTEINRGKINQINQASQTHSARSAWLGQGNTRLHAPVEQSLQPVRQTCPRTTTTCAYMFARFPFSGNFTPTRTSPVKQPSQNNNVIGAGETSRNDKLRVAWEGLGNTRARHANTAKHAPNMLTHHGHVRVHVCTVSIQWEIQTNPLFQLNVNSTSTAYLVHVQPCAAESRRFVIKKVTF